MTVIPLLLPLVLLASGCSFAPDLPETPPPLADMEEPLELGREPDDEAERLRLPAGSFSGLRVGDARDSLAALFEDEAALRVVEVVENSPAEAAGLLVDDVLLEVQVGDGPLRPLQRPSEWRQIELATPPGTRLLLIVDRAGRQARAGLVLVPRVRPAARIAAERFREEDRVGVVLRTATEVEARAAGLGPGGGAVVVGLARGSPWRRAGVRFGDLLTAIDDRPVTHPQEVLVALRDPARREVRLRIHRGDGEQVTTAALSARAHTMREITVPLLFSYEKDRGRCEWSLLLGIFHYRSTAAAWRFRLLWLIGFGGGDADRLLEVDG